MVKSKSIEKSKNVPSITNKIPKKQKHKKQKAKIIVSQRENEIQELPEGSNQITKQDVAVQKTPLPNVMYEGMTMEQIGDKYPVLKDEKLVERFLSVPMNNNQKGRVRQLLRDKLKDTSDSLLPDVIYSKIQLILKSSTNLTDTDLRKIRILYNMLKTAVQKGDSKIGQSKKTEKKVAEKKSLSVENKDAKIKDEKITDVGKEKKEQSVKKVKGKKRYVLFIGNLPLNINKETIMEHFSEISEEIADVRIPKTDKEKKSSIAYIELKNEPTYERALSKHHSMLGTKRINVLYTTQKNGKMSKAEAKSKSAKLQALQKSGRLIGSVPMNRKRSQRRLKLKQARAKEAEA